MRQLLCSALFFFISHLALLGQNLVSSQFLNDYTSGELFSTFGIPARGGIKLYKLQYTTLDAKGLLDTASGLVVIPISNNTSFPLVCHQHGTIDNRERVPSAELDHFGELYLGSEGYVVSSADFIGCGDSRGYHPYLDAATEASAGIDLLRAVRIFCDQERVVLDSRLFVTGYSQGGHAAMAAFKALESVHSDEFTVTAAVLMSGPYDITGTTRDFMLNETAYGFPSYLAHTVRGYKEVNNNFYEQLTDIFKPKYAEVIGRFQHQPDFGLSALNDTLISILTKEFGQPISKFMIQDAVIEAFEKRDTNNIFYRTLLNNNLYNWVPKAPTRLYYCEADEQVPYTNAIVADSVMNSLGAKDVSSLSLGRTLNHFGCAIPAYLNASTFFRGFQPVATQPKVEGNKGIRIAPNPVDQEIFLSSTEVLSNFVPSTYKILDGVGKIVQTGQLLDNVIGVNDLDAGVYFLTLTHQQSVSVIKFIKL